MLKNYNNSTKKNDTEDIDITDDNYMLLDDLQRVTDEFVKSYNDSLEPKLLWKPFVDELLKDIYKFDYKRQKIFIPEIEYLKEIALLLAQVEDNDLLETAVWWTVVDYCVPYSSKELRRIWFSYVDGLTGTSERSWSIFCAENVNDLMGLCRWMSNY